MNGLDIAMLLMMGLGTIVGLRTGLIRALFTVAGLILAFFLAAQFGGDVASLLVDTSTGRTWATIIAYSIIFLVVVLVAWILGAVILKAFNLLPIGCADKVGGLVLGFVGGVLLAAALVVGMARYAYNFELPREGTPGQITGRIEKLDVREGVEKALTGSQIVPIFLDIRGALPSMFGFLPDEFSLALDILDEAIKKGGAAS